MPKVTIITGYYNRAHALRQTIDAILNQTYQDFDFIVFDDCSTDDTKDLLLDIESEYNDPRMKVVFHENNLGFVNGLIRAIDNTDSDLIAIQGSGDISMPTRIEKQADYLSNKPSSAAVGCWYTNVVENLNLRRPRFPNEKDAEFGSLIKANVYSHGEVMYKRSAYNEAGGYRPHFKFCQDYDLWLRMAKIGDLGVVPENLYDRFVRFDGVSYSPNKIGLQTQFRVLAQKLATTPDLELPPLSEFDINALVSIQDPQVQMSLLKACLRSEIFGGRDEARAIMRKSLKSGHRWAAEVALNPPANWALHAMMPIVLKLLKIKNQQN